jgi:nitrogen fixation/metabolism regulation signal transduction histidine kinase
MNNFRVNLIIRTVFITASAVLFAFLCLDNRTFPGHIFFIILTSALIFLQVYLMVRYADRTNHELSDFFQSINYSDFSRHYDFSKSGESFKKLSDQFNRVLMKFKETRSEKEESLNYLRTVVQHVGVGLISFDSKGNVEFLNKAAKKILRINTLKNIKSLDTPGSDFGQFLRNLNVSKKVTYKYSAGSESLQLLIYAVDLRMRGELYRIVALQNIQTELEEKEIEAWQKIIRVLTHEIMNSITPITSLASTMNNLLRSGTPLDNETIEDIGSAAKTIQKRSEGLLNFVDKYRSVTKIPRPDFQLFEIAPLFERIKILMDSALSGNRIQFRTLVNPVYLKIRADSDLIEQVLINLLNNAIQALDGIENGFITLTAQIDEYGRALLQVSDNGHGIAEENLESIFIPFFTTKKDGSGIGLSISQQIIRAHNGRIFVTSKPGEETVFTIRL